MAAQGLPSPLLLLLTHALGWGFFIGVSAHGRDEHPPGIGWERSQRVRFEVEIKQLRVPQHFPGLHPKGCKAAGPHGHLGASWMTGSSQPALKYKCSLLTVSLHDPTLSPNPDTKG